PDQRLSRSSDPETGEKPPKSKGGIRDVPVVDRLRVTLERHCVGRRRDAFVFGSDDAPFTPNNVRRQAERRGRRQPSARSSLVARSISSRLASTRRGIASRRGSTTAGVSETRADQYMGHANPS